MSQTLKTQTATKPQASKPQASKASPKASPKAKQSPKVETLAYAALLAEALAGRFGPIVARFYKNSISHHGKQKTQFPRADYAKVPLLSIEDARDKLEAHRAHSIPNAYTWSRRLFDEMMVQTQQAK